LGIDIYKYSEYEETKQVLIPFVFDLILDETIETVLQSESSLFAEFTKKDNFISTGDGGFVIFPTPLHALVFNLNLYAYLHLFNTGHFFPKLSKYIDGIVVRSSITYDNIFAYENNYYGKAIIVNSRILAKDRLNRFLVDKNTHDYFSKYFNGIESLIITRAIDIKRILKIEGKLDSYIFNNKFRNEILNPWLKNIHIQKVIDLFSKNTKLIIYNVEIQFLGGYIRENVEDSVAFVLTIGNTNVNDINV
jgi:hypothetical protein